MKFSLRTFLSPTHYNIYSPAFLLFSSFPFLFLIQHPTHSLTFTTSIQSSNTSTQPFLQLQVQQLLHCMTGHPQHVLNPWSLRSIRSWLPHQSSRLILQFNQQSQLNSTPLLQIFLLRRFRLLATTLSAALVLQPQQFFHKSSTLSPRIPSQHGLPTPIHRACRQTTHNSYPTSIFWTVRFIKIHRSRTLFSSGPELRTIVVPLVFPTHQPV